MYNRKKMAEIVGSKEEKTILEFLQRLESKIDAYHEEIRGWHQLIGKEHYEMKKEF